MFLEKRKLKVDNLVYIQPYGGDLKLAEFRVLTTTEAK